MILGLRAEGYTQDQIGMMLGVTESRINQKLKSIKKMLEKELLIKNRYAEYKDFEDASKLEIEWIKL